MTQGVYVPGGALNVALNDATTKGAYMPDGRLRVTNVAGSGIQDSSGALRIATAAGQGVYAALSATIQYSNALSDNLTGVQAPGGAIRMSSVGAAPGAITFTPSYLLYAPNNPVAWPVGTATQGGTGTPTWSLADNDGGNFQIDASTGVVSKLTASTLTTAAHSITIAVSGVTPAAPNLVATFNVAPSADFSQPGNVVFH